MGYMILSPSFFLRGKKTVKAVIAKDVNTIQYSTLGYDREISQLTLKTTINKWNIMIVSYIYLQRRSDALDLSRRLYQEGFELFSETLSALIISFGYFGQSKLVSTLYKAIKNRNITLSCATFAKMHACLLEKGNKSVVTEYETLKSKQKAIKSKAIDSLLIRSLSRERDVEALDVFNGEKMCLKNLLFSLMFEIQTLSGNFADAENTMTYIKKVFEIRAVKYNLNFSKVIRNNILENLYVAYENAIQTWPSAQYPNEKEFFRIVLKIIALLYSYNVVYQTLERPNLRTLELSFVANIWAKKKFAAFHDFAKIYKAGCKNIIPSKIFAVIITGLDYSPYALLHLIKV